MPGFFHGGAARNFASKVTSNPFTNVLLTAVELWASILKHRWQKGKAISVRGRGGP
jgi:hypothetical protein